jgi:regulator of protease activity HflC (stomatin/prohibitin superfamily)
MEQNRTRLTVLNLLALLIAGAAGFAVARHANLLSAHIALCFITIGFLVTLVSYFQMRLVEREKMERFEYDELTKAPSASALFNKEETSGLPARRSREQFEKFFVPGFTVLLLLAEAAGAFFLWRWLSKPSAAPMTQSIFALVIFAIFFLVLFILGRFSVTLARLEKQRLLQPVASFVLASAYLSGVVGGAIIAVYAGVPKADLYVARALVLLLAILATETLLTLLLEIYRPRVKGHAARLLYDSRVIGLLSQPESLFTTAAHALDYQFGFKVSDTWIYQTMRLYLPRVVIAEFVIFFLCTSFVVIETGEQALLERFGRPVNQRAILNPGWHLKWPWPIDKVHRYRTEQVQTFSVGLEHDANAEKENTVLWTVSHAKEEFNLLVASRDTTTNTDAARKSPPVNLLSVSIPVQFQITNLTAWAYNNTQPDELLEKIATREVVRYLVNADLIELMSSGRSAAAEGLRERIQAAADQRQLGARIVFVGMQDVHPPVNVAAAYEHVVGARQSAEAKVNVAKAYATTNFAFASSQAHRTVLNAEAEAARIETIALARAASFTNQIPAYRAAPEIYTTRSYLQTLARQGGNVRKYVVATTNTDDVIQFDLTEKYERSLLDVQIPAPKK